METRSKSGGPSFLPVSDGQFMYVPKPLSSCLDLRVASLLSSISCKSMPRLLATGGKKLPTGLPSTLYELPVVDLSLLSPAIAADDDSYLFYEYIRGQVLTVSNGIDPENAKRLYSDISRLLHFLTNAAGEPVLHLDIKPQNIICLEGGGYALIDWASAVIGEQRLKKNFGTKGYLSAERLSGLATARSDAYALARTVVALLLRKKASELTGRDERRALGRLPKSFRARVSEALYDSFSQPILPTEKAGIFRPKEPLPAGPKVSRVNKKTVDISHDDKAYRRPEDVENTKQIEKSNDKRHGSGDAIARAISPYLHQDDQVTVIVIEKQKHRDTDSVIDGSIGSEI